MFNMLIKEICNELNIEYTYLSKEWLIKLTKNNKTVYLANNKFPLNNHVVGLIMDDKYATYEVLKDLDIPVAKHHIFYSENNHKKYTQGCNSNEDLQNIFDEYNRNVVVKPNNGYQGIDVYHITNYSDLTNTTNKLFKNNYSISICPYYHIKNEYRVVVLDNDIKLLYKKNNPTIVGDGIHSIKELLIEFNPYYFSKLSLPEDILPKGEEYTYDFRFNLSKGSTASIDIDAKIKDALIKISKSITTKTNIRFATIDIINTTDDELLVLEINSGVTIDKAIKFLPDGYNIAKSIYKEAIIKLME